MSIQSEIDRISAAVQNAHLKVIEKGGTSAAPYLVANLASAIDTISTGEDVTAETNTYTSLLDDLEAAVDALPDAGSGGASVETCTVEILSAGPTMTTTFQFIDADGAVQHVDCSSSDMLYGVELVVQGNSPLTSDMNISSIQQPEGGAVRLNPYCYYITGDATVYVGG